MLVSALVRACPELHVLAASRQALGVISEVRMPVPPIEQLVVGGGHVAVDASAQLRVARGEIRAGVHGREERALHERDGERKGQIESVRNPGSFVADWRPVEFTARRRSGKTSGKTTFAGWRAVRTTDRRASWPTCSTNLSLTPARARARVPLPPRRRLRASGRSWRGRRRRATAGGAEGSRP